MGTTIQQWEELTPSYGRDYKSAAAAKADFLAGKDFTLARTGQQMSITDVDLSLTVYLRYAKLTKVTPVTVTMKMLSDARDTRATDPAVTRTGARVEALHDYLPITAGSWGTVMGVTGALVQVDFDDYTGEHGIPPRGLKVTDALGRTDGAE